MQQAMLKQRLEACLGEVSELLAGGNADGAVGALLRQYSVLESTSKQYGYQRTAEGFLNRGFKLFHNAGCVAALLQLAQFGMQQLGSVEWHLHHVEALAAQLRQAHPQCLPTGTQLSWASPIPCGSHPTTSQPTVCLTDVDASEGSPLTGVRSETLLAALDALFYSAISTLNRQDELPSGHELIALHRHPDVLLCMRATNWHATAQGQMSLATCLSSEYSRNGALLQSDILKQYMRCPSAMLVLDEEALTSTATPDDVSMHVAKASETRNNLRRPQSLIIIVCGRVLLPGVFQIDSKCSTELHLHFMGFQRWPNVKHAPSLVSHSRGAALSFLGARNQKLKVSFHMLQLELAPPQQLTVGAAEPLYKVATDFFQFEDGTCFPADVEDDLLQHLEMCIEAFQDLPDLLKPLAERLRILGKPIPDWRPSQCVGAHREGPPSLDDKGLLYLLRSQQLLPLLQRLQLPTRPTQQRARTEQVQQEVELRGTLQGDTGIDPRKVDKELRLNGALGHEYCGTLLECCFVKSLEMHECRLTGHGSLAMLLRASHCTSLAFYSCQFEDAGRGIQLEYVSTTLLNSCSISNCLLEGIRCPSIEEVQSSSEYQDYWSSDQFSDASALYEGNCSLCLRLCILTSLLGGGVVMHHGGILNMQHCNVVACGSCPKLAAISVSSCPVYAEVLLADTELTHCPYAAVAFFGPNLLARMARLEMTSCGMGLVMNLGNLSSPELSEVTSIRIRQRQEVMRKEISRSVAKEWPKRKDDIMASLVQRQVVTVMYDTDYAFCDGPGIRVGKGCFLFMVRGKARDNLQVPRDDGALEWQSDLCVDSAGDYYYCQCDILTPENKSSGRRSKARRHATLPPSVACSPVHTWGARLLPHLLLQLPAACISQRQASLCQAYEQALRHRMVRALYHPRPVSLLEPASPQGSQATTDQVPVTRTSSSESGSFRSEDPQDVQSLSSSNYASGEEEEVLRRQTAEEYQQLLRGHLHTGELPQSPQLYGNDATYGGYTEDEDDALLNADDDELQQGMLLQQLQRAANSGNPADHRLAAAFQDCGVAWQRNLAPGGPGDPGGLVYERLQQLTDQLLRQHLQGGT